MNKLTLLATAALCALSLFSAPPKANAATDATADTTPVSKATKDLSYPFHGKVKIIDLKFNTFTVGDSSPRLYCVDPTTKIKKNGKPASLADAVVSDDCGGRVTKGADGKLHVISVRFGPKPEKLGGKGNTSPAPTP